MEKIEDITEKRLLAFTHVEYILPIYRPINEVSAVETAVREALSFLDAGACSASDEDHDSQTSNVVEKKV